ncbi:MAG: tetratricopeptide repeat protein, partial [Actinomycetota bacterium]|nr:tetratricopeptide repeat protein [Actinomycetota bacterium]
MPTRSLIRAGVVALSVAGVVAGVVTFRSEEKVEDAFGAAIENRPIEEVERLFEDSRPLNPGAARELAMARANHRAGRPDRAEELLAEAAELEPKNIRVWYLRARLALTRGDRPAAQRHWA